MPKGEKNRKLSDEQRRQLVIRYTTPNADGTWNGSKVLALEFGVTPTAIIWNLRREGVSIRNAKASHSNGKRCKPVTRLPKGVAPQCKCGCGQTTPWLTYKDSWAIYARGHYRPDAPYKDRDWLDMEYTIKQRPGAEIAAECGVNPGIIYRFLKHFGIARRTTKESLIVNESMRGHRNPSFKDGRAKWDYSQEWKRLSREIRQRDGYRCKVCDVYLPPPSKRLHVHHMDSDRFNNADSNLITVCVDCHPKGAVAEAAFRERYAS